MGWSLLNKGSERDLYFYQQVLKTLKLDGDILEEKGNSKLEQPQKTLLNLVVCGWFIPNG